ncbi:hypothetical protein K466DRAFT_580066 [Polyporus arcularius HHB13444]|uniref:BTB domain-containing protein n=1 Tax=Polyporus arcularius HHB13444 TaxID=1314778 RepID=A0A5C3Q274_9APHY|nr:hypothetical protein K466DRAFT_580066 [Polyporus arcularius HHB13444]
MPDTTETSSTCTRDSEFFKDQKPLFIRVENVSFCVPPLYFDDSEAFKSMFSLPATPDGTQDGSSEERPLLLEGVRADDFRDLLRVLSPRMTSLSPSENSHDYIRERPTSWVAVLDLATRWEIPSARSWALEALKSEECCTRLMLARKYDIVEWWTTTMQSLVARRSPLTREEFDILGVDLAVRVVALREGIRRSILRDPTKEEIKEAHGL